MTKHDRTLDRLFHALADPTQRAMMQALLRGLAPLCALAAPTGLCILDPRAGGRFYTVMEVNGTTSPSDGSFLEGIPQTRLVFTDLLLSD